MRESSPKPVLVLSPAGARGGGRRELEARDLEPGAVLDPPGHAREEIGQEHLPAVLPSKRGMRLFNRVGLAHDPRASLQPCAADPTPRIRRRNASSGGIAQPLDLTRLL